MIKNSGIGPMPRSIKGRGPGAIQIYVEMHNFSTGRKKRKKREGNRINHCKDEKHLLQVGSQPEGE
jgi:ribonuclease PH